jgi:hypothetical protein
MYTKNIKINNFMNFHNIDHFDIVPVLSSGNLRGGGRWYGRLLDTFFSRCYTKCPIITLLLSFDTGSEMKNCCNNAVALHYMNWQKRFNFHALCIIAYYA